MGIFYGSSLLDGDRSTAAVATLGATTVRLRTTLWLKLPDVAVTFTCEVAVAAEPLTVNSSSKPPLALNEAVTPFGSPVADSVTLPVNPLSGLKVMAVSPLPPWTTRKVGGASASAKSGGAVTVTVIVTAEVRLPEVPVTVKEDTFAAAALVAVSVSVLVDVALAGLNDAVTPVGKPVALKATLPLNPPRGVTVMVAVSLPPAATFTLETEESVKLGSAATVRASPVCATSAPDVAVMVSAAGPTTAVGAAINFSVLPVNAAVTPVGIPTIARVGVPVKPFSGVTVKVLVPVAPCITLKLAGEAATVKLGPAFTVRLMLVVVVDVPSVPVTVMVLVPTGAVEVALNVSTLVVAVDAGLDEAVTPLGSVDAVSVTLPVKPILGVMVIVLVAPAPCTTFSVGVEVEIE
jgi:hypothetical protein